MEKPFKPIKLSDITSGMTKEEMKEFAAGCRFLFGSPEEPEEESELTATSAKTSALKKQTPQ